MSNKDTFLAKELQIGPRIISNRFAINAMEGNDANLDGTPSEKTYRRYERLVRGGAKFIDIESVTLQTKSRARKYQMALLPENVEAFKAFFKYLKDIDPEVLLVVQLNHSGEISSNEFSTRKIVKPITGYDEGEIITEEEVDEVIDSFIKAAKVFYDIGADGVEVKLCHGYLGSNILRPYNDRDWKYGGSWENRSSFAYKIYEGIRKVVPDENFLVGSKISMWEGFPGGQGCAGPDTPIMDLTESIDLCKGLEARGASFLLQSTGTILYSRAHHCPQRFKPDDAYLHMTMAKIMREAVSEKVKIIGSAYSVIGNGNNDLQGVSPEQNSLIHWSNYNIEHGYVDMVALGRQSMADPYTPIKYLEDRENEIKWCTACGGCGELLRRQVNVGCVVYDDKEYAQSLKEQREKFGEYKFTQRMK